ncbi:hypothetical protein APR04_001485 [Promicromonospora umidemergens]|nr:hypothetical protein [Promicromonospora umidemergens]MCP2282587.1 hypothetical protein [Promicromonospora umidemergens]
MRAIVGVLVTATLFGTGATVASAAEKAPAQQQAGVITFVELERQGFTEAEIEAAIANSPNLGIGYGPLPAEGNGEISTKGVTFGKFIYVRMSKAAAKAINNGSAATAIALFSLAGPAGLVIATAIYVTVADYNNSQLDRCARWEFRYTYPLPNIPPLLVQAKCY